MQTQGLAAWLTYHILRLLQPRLYFITKNDYYMHAFREVQLNGIPYMEYRLVKDKVGAAMWKKKAGKAFIKYSQIHGLKLERYVRQK